MLKQLELELVGESARRIDTVKAPPLGDVIWRLADVLSKVIAKLKSLTVYRSQVSMAIRVKIYIRASWVYFIVFLSAAASTSPRGVPDETGSYDWQSQSARNGDVPS